jgi:cytochrome b pre-mRNA-processing protein 3
MLRFLFPGLTQSESRGAKLFAAVSAQAREAHWYVEGGAPDTLDGRFAMLATIAALAVVRLEQGGHAGAEASTALTERFIETMDAEHRQLGMGDPAVGRTVRRLVGSLARRVELWRKAVGNEVAWEEAVTESLFRGTAASRPELRHCSQRLRELWTSLESASDSELAEGRIG